MRKKLTREKYDSAYHIPSLNELMAMDIKRRVEDEAYKKKRKAVA